MHCAQLSSYHQVAALSSAKRDWDQLVLHKDANKTLTIPTSSHPRLTRRNAPSWIYKMHISSLRDIHMEDFNSIQTRASKIKISPKLSWVFHSTTHVAFILNTIYKTRSKTFLKETNFYKTDFTRNSFLQTYTCNVQKKILLKNKLGLTDSFLLYF